MKKNIMMIAVLALGFHQLDAGRGAPTSVTITNRSTSGIAVTVEGTPVNSMGVTMQITPGKAYKVRATTTNKKGPNYSREMTAFFKSGSYEIKAVINAISSDPDNMMTLSVGRPKTSAATSSYSSSYNYDDEY